MTAVLLTGESALDPQLLSLIQPIFPIFLVGDPLCQIWKFSAYKWESTIDVCLEYVTITSFMHVIYVSYTNVLTAVVCFYTFWFQVGL